MIVIHKFGYFFVYKLRNYDASWNLIIVPGFILKLSILETILQIMFHLTSAFGFNTTEHNYTLLLSSIGFILKLSCGILWGFQAISNFLILCQNLQISKCKNNYFPFWILGTLTPSLYSCAILYGEIKANHDLYEGSLHTFIQIT